MMILDTAKGVNQMTRNTKPLDEALELAELEELEVTEEEVEAEITFSAKDLASEVNTDAKSFRRWLRSWTNARANKGGRWVFTEETKAEVLAAYREAHAPKAEVKPEA